MIDVAQNRFTAITLTCLTVLFVATGCFKLSRGAPAPQHYVLGGALSVGAPAPHGDSLSPSIGLRRPQIASYLDAPFIVVRQGTHQIGFSEFHRWGEQLGGGINRALAGHLAERGAFRAIHAAPWSPTERPDYLIQLDVVHFEGVIPEGGSAAEGEVHMLVTWEVLRRSDGTVLSRGATDHRERGWRGEDYRTLVAHLSAALGVLADDLVAAVEAVARDGRPPPASSGDLPPGWPPDRLR